MAVRNPEAVQRLQGATAVVESCPGRIGPISLGAKQAGERSAGNPHAAFDVAGAGNVVRSKKVDQIDAPVPDPTWESPGVKVPRATRHPRSSAAVASMLEVHSAPDDRRNKDRNVGLTPDRVEFLLNTVGQQRAKFCRHSRSFGRQNRTRNIKGPACPSQGTIMQRCCAPRVKLIE